MPGRPAADHAAGELVEELGFPMATGPNTQQHHPFRLCRFRSSG